MRARASALLLACIGGTSALAAVVPLGAGPPASFRPAVDYTTGGGSFPRSVAIGDLNGDGSPDLVTADYVPSTVSVLLNRGDGRFQAKHDYRSGQFPVSVVIGDLNDDGKQDLVTASPNSNKISTLLNRGDGSFQQELEYRTGVRPQSVAVGDLTGDGKPEVVTVNAYLAEPKRRNPGTVSVFVNNGDGTLQPKLDYRPGKFPRSVAIADLNADGKPDLATANVDDDTVSVFVNRGAGSFEPKRDYPAGAGPRAVAIGDLDNDGKPDLVTANTGTRMVSVLLGKGDGSFRAPRSHRVGDQPYAVAIGDLNGDRKPDLATANQCSDTPVSVLVNRGDGSFGEKLNYRTGVCPESVAIGDLSGDRENDLVTANSIGNGVSVLINRPGRCTVQFVVRMRLAAAKRTTIRADCRVGTISRAYSKFGGKGTVVAQTPRFGAVLRKGGKVNLIVSRGPHR